MLPWPLVIPSGHLQPHFADKATGPREVPATCPKQGLRFSGTSLRMWVPCPLSWLLPGIISGSFYLSLEKSQGGADKGSCRQRQEAGSSGLRPSTLDVAGLLQPQALNLTQAQATFQGDSATARPTGAKEALFRGLRSLAFPLTLSLF